MVDATGLLLVADGVGVTDVVAFAAALAVVVLGLADVDAFEDADELAVAVVVCAEGEGSLLAVGDFEAVAVDVAVLEVLAVGSLVDGCGLGELLGVVVGVGVGVGEEVESCNGWHCCTAPAEAATAAVSSMNWAAGAAADAASENPEAAAARTPPVMTPATTGCTRAIRMKTPYPCCSWYAVLVPYAPIGHHRRCPVLVHPYPLSANDHSATRVI